MKGKVSTKGSLGNGMGGINKRPLGTKVAKSTTQPSRQKKMK